MKLEQFIVIKERERQIDEETSQQWRNARKYFFQHQIKNALEDITTQKDIQQIAQLFINQRLDAHGKIAIILSQQSSLLKYQNTIQQLSAAYNSIEEFNRTIQRKCSPIEEIIKANYATLKIIKIEYDPKIGSFGNHYYLYCISTFSLFKVIQNNPQLTQVTLKGILVQQFQEFIVQLYSFNNITQQKQTKQITQVRNPHQSKNLKLSINAQLLFDFFDQQKTQTCINNLSFFIGMFYSLSCLTVKIRLKYWQDIQIWGQTLENLFACLLKIGEIELGIIGFPQNFISPQSVHIVRSTLFSRLSSFTEIVSLQFEYFLFSSKLGPSDFLALGEILTEIVRNNKVSRLKLSHCLSFPVFPQMDTLEQIHLADVSFWRDLNFLAQVTQTNHNLRSIICILMSQLWKIDEKIFNQLQTLIIFNCFEITLDDFKPQSPSNIKNLSLSFCSLGNIDGLSVMLPKLSNLKSLYINSYSFESRLLFAIPSLDLQELTIKDTNFIAIQTFKSIDQKWPHLRTIQITARVPGKKIQEEIWKECKFEGLMELKADQQMLGQEKRALRNLKMRGIKVIY